MFTAILLSYWTRIFILTLALMTGFFSEIGLNELNSKSGPAIKRMIPIYPITPRAILRMRGIGFPSGFL